MKKQIVITSGGLDSTVLLHQLIKEGNQVRALGIDYGQRHRRELQHALAISITLNIPFQIADLSCLAGLFPGNSQTDLSVPVPEGHYAEETMKQTVVPNRNMIFLSVAIGVAIARKFDGVAYAAHAGDHTIYPDCREEFVDALGVAARLCDWDEIEIARPFVYMSKSEIVSLGADLGVDFSLTYSCYKGGEKHCGKCGTCVERIEAFQLANVPDPTVYEK